MSFILTHWRPVIGALALVLAASFGAYQGYRYGYQSGYAAGAASVPSCPEVKANVEGSACIQRSAIQYEIKEIPSPRVGCPPVSIPIPTFTFDSDFKSGGATAIAGVPRDEHQPDRVSPAPAGPSAESGVRNHATVLTGVGATGLEIGASYSRRLFGPIEGGIWGRVPLKAVNQSSLGVSLGVQW